MATSEGIPSSIDIEFLELNDNPYNKAVREGQNVKSEYADKKVRMRYVCDNLGDEFLKRMVSRMVEDIEKAVKKN